MERGETVHLVKTADKTLTRAGRPKPF